MVQAVRFLRAEAGLFALVVAVHKTTRASQITLNMLMVAFLNVSYRSLDRSLGPTQRTGRVLGFLPMNDHASGIRPDALRTAFSLDRLGGAMRFRHLASIFADRVVQPNVAARQFACIVGRKIPKHSVALCDFGKSSNQRADSHLGASSRSLKFYSASSTRLRAIKSLSLGSASATVRGRPRLAANTSGGFEATHALRSWE
jgi:hypothetical protein